MREEEAKDLAWLSKDMSFMACVFQLGPIPQSSQNLFA